MDEQERLAYHRLFGAFLRDLFTGQPVDVVTEFDVSQQQQFLDVVLVRKGSEPLTMRLPDGLEELAPYNLISFKSHQETLDALALDELVGHYVGYLKYKSERPTLLPLTDFRLLAISVRFPRELARQLTLRRIRAGVYAVNSFTQEIRIIVAHELAQEDQNALLHLFSAKAEGLAFARLHYQVKSTLASTLLAQLLGRYRVEGIEMPLDVDKWIQEMQERMDMTSLERLTPEQRREVLKKVPAEERVAGLAPEELLKALSPEAIEALRRQLAADKPSDAK
jgi:hypothetical protein